MATLMSNYHNYLVKKDNTVFPKSLEDGMVHNLKYEKKKNIPYKVEDNYFKMYFLIEELFLFQTRLIFSSPFIKSQSVLMNLNIDMK